MSNHNLWSRRIMAENVLTAKDLIFSVLVGDKNQELTSMPGVSVYSSYSIDDVLDDAIDFGISAVNLVPVNGLDSDDSLISDLLPYLSNKKMPLGLVVDLSCDYLKDISGDALIEVLIDKSLLFADLGVNIIILPFFAIKIVKSNLVAKKHHNVLLIAGANYNSNFRLTNSLDDNFDINSYFFDIANCNEVLMSAEKLDNADAILVSPASLSLDVIARLNSSVKLPVFAMHTRGEYLQNRLYASFCEVNPTAVIYENLLAMKRSGSRGIFTYAALDVIKEFGLIN